MKRFRMKLPVYIVLLLALGAASGAVAVVFNVLKIFSAATAQGVVLLALLIALALLLTALCASVLVYPYYTVKNGRLYSVMGVLRASYDVNEISELVYFKAQGKLVMYTVSDKFTVLLLAESKHEAFIKALRAQNPKILYDNKINETD